MDEDQSEALATQVMAAAEGGTALCIRGGGSKGFYGREAVGEVLSVAGHRGIVAYDPGELVLTARAGTPLSELEQRLAEQGQALPFDPPCFASGATLGGAVAAGLSGPARPWTGAVRDLVLGVKLLDGRGRVLRFGGQVMKNVAGYDLSRLVVGAMGTLGLLLEVSVKVLPVAQVHRSLVWPVDQGEAIRRMNRWAGQPLPLSGAAFFEGRLVVRLSGAFQAVEETVAHLGGETMEGEDAFWTQGVRDQGHRFFAGDSPLWRLSVPPATAPLEGLPETVFLDWGGAQRWYRGAQDPVRARGLAQQAGGHASLFRGGDRNAEVFHPLSPRMFALHRQVKQVLDPMGIFNPGRLYAGF